MRQPALHDLAQQLRGRAERQVRQRQGVDDRRLDPADGGAAFAQHPVAARGQAPAGVLGQGVAQHALPHVGRRQPHAPAQALQRVRLLRILRRRDLQRPRQAHHAVPCQRRELRLQFRARGHAQELVGIEREHCVGATAQQRVVREHREPLVLAERRGRVRVHLDRQALGRQRGEYAWRLVGGTMVDQHQLVEQGGMVAHEGFDDVGLVAQHGDADQAHARGLRGKVTGRGAAARDRAPRASVLRPPRTARRRPCRCRCTS